MSGALDGIRVIELASYVSGPFASVLLADLGAEVIKVESPGEGDPFRGWGENKYGSNFRSLNRNKKSITLDIRRDEGREIFLKIASGCDVLVENLRPGAMKRRGFDYESIRKLNPKIIYCSISGYGQEGPYRDRPGFDTVGQGMSGLLSLLTDPDKPQGVGISLSDHLSGMYASYGVLAALFNRMATGEGQWVETSLLRSSVSFLSENAVRFFETGVVPRRAYRTHTAGVFAFVDKEDKPFIIHLSSPRKFFIGLADIVGKPELADDPRFLDRKGIVDNHDELEKLLQDVFRGGRREDWLHLLQEKDVPCSPLNNLEEVFNDPQVKQYGFPVEVEHPKMGKMPLIGSGVQLSRTPPTIKTAPPILGEHTDEILRSISCDEQTIRKLRTDGVV